MTTLRVLWLGPRSSEARRLVAAGLAVEAHATLASAALLLREVDVVVVACTTLVAPVVAAAPASTKVVALVEAPDDVMAALGAGAHDAAMSLDELMIRFLARRGDDLQREVARLRDETHRDALTGLGNRRSFAEKLGHAIDFASRYGGPVAVILADLDGLKAINDARGHGAGDTALRSVAEVLRGSLRVTDHAARLGGDELGVVLPSTNAAAAAQVAERVRARIEVLMLPGAMRLSASFGVAALEPPFRGVGLHADDLVARADAALYDAKRGGKNRVREDSAA